MEKTKETTTETTLEKAIKKHAKASGYELTEIIDEQKGIVAFGHKRITYCELGKYNKGSKRFEILSVDGQRSFSGFVEKAKLKYLKNDT